MKSDIIVEYHLPYTMTLKATFSSMSSLYVGQASINLSSGFISEAGKSRLRDTVMHVQAYRVFEAVIIMK